jgi:CHASE2 domain-containing sensor protein
MSYPEIGGMGFITDILKAAYLIITMLVAALLIILGWHTPDPQGFFIVLIGVWVLILMGSISIILAAYGLGKWP